MKRQDTLTPFADSIFDYIRKFPNGVTREGLKNHLGLTGDDEGTHRRRIRLSEALVKLEQSGSLRRDRRGASHVEFLVPKGA